MPVLTPEEFSAGLKGMVRSGALQKGMVAAAATVGQAALGYAGRRLSGNVLNVRSGALKGSLMADHRINKDGSVSGWVQAGGMGTRGRVDYAKIHEYGSAYLPGGVIRPKKAGGFLAFPISADANTQDRPTGTRRSATSGSRWAFVRSVKIPKRPYLAPSVSDAVRVHMDKALTKHVGGAIMQSLRGVSGGA